MLFRSEKGIDTIDSVGKSVEDLKNVNMDSVKKGVREGLKALDSVKRLLKKEDIN